MSVILNPIPHRSFLMPLQSLFMFSKSSAEDLLYVEKGKQITRVSKSLDVDLQFLPGDIILIGTGRKTVDLFVCFIS